MIDRLPPAEQVAAQERRPRQQGEGARGDFNDWLRSHSQSQTAGQGERASEAATMSTDAQLQQASATTTSSSTAVAIELQFMTADGRQETVVVPMRLAATGRLEWAASTRSPGLPVALQTIRQAPLLQYAAAQNRQGGVVAMPHAMPRVDGESMLLPAHRAHGEPHAEPTGDDADVRPAPAWLTVAAESWLERLVRWSQRQGQDPTVWVRDYRLDEGASRDLTRSLRSRAHAQGFELARIVVNGRELWRAPSNVQSQEMA